jgi:hypothetical protein
MQDNKELLILSCIELFQEFKNLTPGPQVEKWLNEKYSPSSSAYKELSRLTQLGVNEGWAANIEVGGERYRRSRLCDPSERTMFLSITCVYMDSMALGESPEQSFRGDYHGHPYGEFNMVIPLSETSFIAGPSGWCHSGWTAPGPGSHHYPEVKGGKIIALFFLPAGRISYEFSPGDFQPVY